MRGHRGRWDSRVLSEARRAIHLQRPRRLSRRGAALRVPRPRDRSLAIVRRASTATPAGATRTVNLVVACLRTASSTRCVRAASATLRAARISTAGAASALRWASSPVTARMARSGTIARTTRSVSGICVNEPGNPGLCETGALPAACLNDEDCRVGFCARSLSAESDERGDCSDGALGSPCERNEHCESGFGGVRRGGWPRVHDWSTGRPLQARRPVFEPDLRRRAVRRPGRLSSRLPGSACENEDDCDSATCVEVDYPQILCSGRAAGDPCNRDADCDGQLCMGATSARREPASERGSREQRRAAARAVAERAREC